MAAVRKIIADLYGTFSVYFQIGPKGSALRLSNTSSNLQVMNETGSALTGVYSEWSQALHYQPAVLTDSYTIPANYQAVFVDEVTGTGTLTILGQVCVVE